MPGRAQQMTPNQAYEMGGSRWGVISKVLNNKKALDLAIQKHIWEMQKQSEALERQKLANERSGQSNAEKLATGQPPTVSTPPTPSVWLDEGSFNRPQTSQQPTNTGKKEKYKVGQKIKKNGKVYTYKGNDEWEY